MAKSDVSLEVKGSDRLTDHSPADLTAVVSNSSDITVRVDVRADAGRNEVRIAQKHSDLSRVEAGKPVLVQVAPQSSELVFIEIRARKPVRPGKTAVVVIATPRPLPSKHAHSKTPADPAVTRELKVELAGTELLPGLVQIGSAVIVPGLFSVAAALQVWVYDRRRLGLEANAASIMWANKLWLLAATAISLAAAWVSTAWFHRPDLLDAFSWSELWAVTVVSCLSAAGLAKIALWMFRLRRPIVTESSSPWDVLRAAARHDGPAFERPVYSTPGDQPLFGLLVHHDGGVTALTAPIKISGPDELVDLCSLPKGDEKRDLKEAVKIIKKDGQALNDFTFASLAGWVNGPTLVINPRPHTEHPESMLKYEDPPA
ncbi:hypothetical protein OG426_54510 (plasmid) [Streptomyces canus]|uniref:hypothetical protein n=1 Tax=Streptomyces canus TaxID=58343 RepID=UPI002F9115D0|nr:hypothetical protein OG426_54510 [Streptomyces canus]